MIEEVFVRLDCIFGDSNGHRAVIDYIKKHTECPNAVEAVRKWLYEKSSFTHEDIDIWLEVQRDRISNVFGSYHK